MVRYPWDDLLSDYDGRGLTESQKLQHGYYKRSDWGDTHDLYLCPTDKATNEAGEIARSYAVNAGYPRNWSGSGGPIMSGWWTANGSNDPPWSMRLGSIRTPTTDILLVDYRRWYAGEIAALGHNAGNAATTTRMSDFIQAEPQVHGQFLKSNYLFCDMHVEFLDFRDTYRGTEKDLLANPSDGRTTMWDCRD